MDDDPTIEKDNEGRGGAKQLWVPRKRQRERGTFVYATQRGLDAADTMQEVDLAMAVMEKFGKKVKRCEVSGELGIEYTEAMCKDRHSRWGNDVDDDRTKLKM